MIPLVLACVALVVLCVAGYLALFTKTFLADDDLVGYFAVSEREEGGDYKENLAIDVHEDGTAIIYYRGRRMLGTIVRDGDFHGSARYRVDDIRRSNGSPIDGVSVGLAVPLEACKGEHTGIWAICLEDKREGSEILRSEVAVINDDGTADMQVLKNKDIFEEEWEPRETTSQTWTERSNGVYSFLTTESGYRREVNFPA